MSEPPRLRGEVRVVDDVATAYGDLLADTVEVAPPGPFVLGCSGGASGAAVLGAAVATGRVEWSRVELVFADERCVPPDSPDANERVIRDVLGTRAADLAGFHPMRCEAGAPAYDALLRRLGRIDLLQLGFGPDGHTASLFPGSAGLDAPPGRLVTENLDPTGTNRLARLTLTLAGIALARLVVVTVIGAEKAAALAAVSAGEALPAARLQAERLVWIVDRAAAGAGRG